MPILTATDDIADTTLSHISYLQCGVLGTQTAQHEVDAWTDRDK